MLRVNFIMIYIIYKVSVLLKITRILKRFLRSIIDLYSFKIPKLSLLAIRRKRKEKIGGSQSFWRKLLLSMEAILFTETIYLCGSPFLLVPFSKSHSF